MSAPTQLELVVDILESLVLHMINQFFSMMMYYIKLVLSGHTPFEFVRPLLENHVESV